jgi:putative addiction module component (TIGR02574 family)
MGLTQKDAAEVLRDALSLPPEARAALIDSLLESLDVEVDDNAEEAWREEIFRRLQQIDSGAAKLIPWDGAQRRLWARLQR